MYQEDIEEIEWKKLMEKKWDIFWKRYKELYPNSCLFSLEVAKKIEEMFEKTSPFIGEKLATEFYLDENGKIKTFEQFFLMFGAIGEIFQNEFNNLIKKETETLNQELIEIKNKLQRMGRLLKYAIPDMENLIECPHCKDLNPPDKKFCVHCNSQISTIEARFIPKKNDENE